MTVDVDLYLATRRQFDDPGDRTDAELKERLAEIEDQLKLAEKNAALIDPILLTSLRQDGRAI